MNTSDESLVTMFTQEADGEWFDWPTENRPPAHIFDKIRPRSDAKYKLFDAPPLGVVHVHSVRLASGDEWDCQRGWRPKRVH
jgi:hypothetical protein